MKNALLAAGVLSFPYLRAGVLADSVSVPADDKEPVSGDFRKSIMWGTVGMEGSVLDKCKAIKAAGYDGIEPNSHMDRDEVLAAMPEDEDAQALLGLCYTLARRQGEAEAVLAPLAAGEGPRAELAAGLLEKLRQEP
mgnify:CR=1 FL=1